MQARNDRLWGCLAAPLGAMQDMLRSGTHRVVHRGGRRFVVLDDDDANGRLVCQLARERESAKRGRQTPLRLIAFREDFRRIARRGRIAGLFPCIDSRDPEAVRIAIWLMARTGARIAVREIALHSGSLDVRVRREAARALKRLSAWAELRWVAEHDPDLQTRLLATPRSPKPFAERWSAMTRDIEPLMAPRLPMPFFARLPIGPGRTAKTPEIVRAILERIRRAVRGR